ncbi:hypothetical protein KC360_g5368 [Hortaea werneckii]|nr:hypothetical protein KC325_g5655 [Hortaea werneckii]KAI6992136.1 hypothetical protein KC359_g5854 [Hortaea werneckii]KAI7144418.1 hypothetical protein KC344_g5419 [Hortaea werneckii]KAI7172684.1 hypothetical protein KC360_g5368 [Hortaea werneckii]
MSRRQELETAAAEVISILKDIPVFQDAAILVIGGLALWRYIPRGRTTQDVDFSIGVRGAPQSVKKKLLDLPKSPFVQPAQIFFYVNQSGAQIQIDMVSLDAVPYIPPSAIKIKDISNGAISYISVEDLICFKINSCGMRAELKKRRTDAGDAESLLSNAVAKLPMTLSPSQREDIKGCIEDVVKYGDKSEDWWLKNLGLSAQ